MKVKIVLLILTISIVAGCASTSISDSGYKRNNEQRSWHQNYEPEAGKELNELAVIGVAPNATFDEEQILKSLKEAKPFELTSGSRILLLQSGAQYPDSEMVNSMSSYWDVSTLSGDSRHYANKGSLNKLLRYTAATGGNGYVVVYWGVIETAEKNLQTKGISWVPLLGWSLPDEKTQIRVILKFAIIDVASGQWKMFQPSPVKDEFLSAIINRDGKAQGVEIEMKKAVYARAAKELHMKLAM